MRVNYTVLVHKVDYTEADTGEEETMLMNPQPWAFDDVNARNAMEFVDNLQDELRLYLAEETEIREIHFSIQAVDRSETYSLGKTDDGYLSASPAATEWTVRDLNKAQRQVAQSISNRFEYMDAEKAAAFEGFV